MTPLSLWRHARLATLEGNGWGQIDDGARDWAGRPVLLKRRRAVAGLVMRFANVSTCRHLTGTIASSPKPFSLPPTPLPSPWVTTAISLARRGVGRYCCASAPGRMRLPW